MKNFLKKYSVFFAICFLSGCLFLIADAGNFRSTTTSNTAQAVQTGSTSLYHFNVINTSTVEVIYVKLYDFQPYTTGTVTVSLPTYTNTPSVTLQCQPSGATQSGEIWYGLNSNRNSPYAINFQYGCYIRTVTGAADSYTVSPSSSPIVEITTY